jgi:hypothetical protein
MLNLPHLDRPTFQVFQPVAYRFNSLEKKRKKYTFSIKAAVSVKRNRFLQLGRLVDSPVKP